MSAEPISTPQVAAFGPPVSVVILTKDEEANIEDCLRSCAWCDDVHVLDSGSKDRTTEIAARLGATVHYHPFTSFGEQRNWAIDNIEHKYDWVFHLDADERFTPDLVEELQSTIAREPDDAGFYVPHKLMFMGRWLRYAEGGYPIYQMRFFHRERMRFRDYGHGQREATDGRIGILHRPYLHFNISKGLDDWIDKHNHYSALEASETFALLSGKPTTSYSAFGNAIERRRFLKSRVYPKLPGTWFGRFVWMYFLRFGFLDGKAGLQYCLLMSSYDLFTSLKLSELQRKAKGNQERLPQPAVTADQIRPSPRATVGSERADKPDNGHPRPTSVVPSVGEREGMSFGQKEESPWSMREKIGRVVWMFVQGTLFRHSFHNWYMLRRMMLRCFGAKVGRNVRVRPTVRVEIPWHLELADDVSVGDFAILYSLGRIRIGRGTTISQYAHLCAGTHDYTKPQFPLICPPITIGQDVWVAADSFIGPNVTVGDHAIVGARATVVRDVPAAQIFGGNPARFLKHRQMSVPVAEQSPAAEPDR
ncbi:glycosyltransferase [Humisphaera borealis]|uniref:Glycosyltransferase n=1 Tax=Humisphaera borealis TaxID=2807512 RepID=A0A7M2X016_9BACT|nr:glycosyltransferase [Humisphaera borealis]QOV91088.1 glycosyltransferase [Humisphaera borealis]